MSWIILFLAGLFEVAWAVGLTSIGLGIGATIALLAS